MRLKTGSARRRREPIESGDRDVFTKRHLPSFARERRAATQRDRATPRMRQRVGTELGYAEEKDAERGGSIAERSCSRTS